MAKAEGVFSMGPHTLEVSPLLVQENRARVLARLSEYSDSILFLQGGDDIPFYSTDVNYYFRQEPFFFYLFGVLDPGYYGTIHVKSGKVTLFFPRLPEDYATWMGPLPTSDSIQQKYNVESAYNVDEMERVLGSWSFERVLVLRGKNSDSGLEMEPPTWKGLSKYSVNDQVLYPLVSECRVTKSPREIEVLRYCNKISSEAHKKVMRTVKPGLWEYQAESTFLHHCYSEGGSRYTGYCCICCSGENGSILHYGHAGTPNDRRIEDGDMLLFDMGASYFGYCADITCSFPANGKFTEDQKMVYNSVLAARDAVIAAMKPGVSWVEMHKLALRKLLEGLRAGGVVVGAVEDMLAAGLGGLFQPHGLGHLLGLDVHDVGGYPPGGPLRPTEPWLRCLRTARPLLPGMFITVEPGCYFIDYLLDRALADKVQSKFLVPEVIARLRGFGGIRIEDNVLVTEDGAEVLTEVPRTVEEIEAWMAGGCS